jgi:hypothetical protein
LSKKCELQVATEKYRNQILTTSLYINCGSILVQVSAVYLINSFFWISKDSINIDQPKQFGDIQRVFSKFDLITLLDDDKNRYFCPSNIDLFIYDYGHSKYIDCNNNNPMASSDFDIDRERNVIVKKSLSYIISVIENLNKNYWLDGSSLLSL